MIHHNSELQPNNPNITSCLSNLCPRSPLKWGADWQMSSLCLSPTPRSQHHRRTSSNYIDGYMDDDVFHDMMTPDIRDETLRPTRNSTYCAALSYDTSTNLARAPSLPSTNNSSTSHRSRSPVKQVTGLHDIEGRVVYADFNHNIEVLGEGRKQLYRELTKVADKGGAEWKNAVHSGLFRLVLEESGIAVDNQVYIVHRWITV
jgi:hypothetical protein